MVLLNLGDQLAQLPLLLDQLNISFSKVDLDDGWVDLFAAELLILALLNSILYLSPESKFEAEFILVLHKALW